MIDKITSENGTSFYKPAFDLINKALAEQKATRTDADAMAAFRDVNEINSLEDYFVNIEAIRALWVNIAERQIPSPGGYLLLMPADEDIFMINANTREIAVPASVKKNGVGVFGDDGAEMLVLRIDRYFDNQDLLKCDCAINWTFTPQGSRQPSEQSAELAFVPNADLKPGYITFGFIITKDMTKSKGVLNFSVTFYKASSGQITYSFNSLTASVNINDTLSLQDPSMIKNNVDNYLGRLTNSAYSDSTMPPISAPVWQSGDQDATSQAFLGLPNFAYLPASTDMSGAYVDGNGVTLRAYAGCEPSTATVLYRWSFIPAELYDNGETVKMNRTQETKNFRMSYIPVNVEDMTDNALYYISEDDGRTVIVTEEPYGDPTAADPITLKVQYTKAEVLELQEQVAAQDGLEMPTFFALGSANEALMAGRYQVFARGRLGAGSYTALAEGEEPKAGVSYYVGTDMDDDGTINIDDEIDIAHPLRNDAAVAAKAAGKQLYFFVGGVSNSAEVDSNVCEVPGAKKPVVNLTVTTSFDFGDNTDVTVDDESRSRYVYIEDTVLPDLKVEVSIPEGTNEDCAGQFAAQLINKNAPAIVNWESEDEEEVTMSSLINDGLQFNSLTFDGNEIGTLVSTGDAEEATEPGKFFVQEVSEGEYAVRVFNHRNNTYAFADSSSALETSYVAPAITDITVTLLQAGIGNDVNAVDPVVVIDQGERPMEDNERKLVDLEIINGRRDKFIFEMVDNYQEEKRSKPLGIVYQIEEVDYDSTTGVITERIPGSAEEFGRQEDIRTIVASEDEFGALHYYFNIDNDPGFYRIKVITTYNGTTRVSHTDIFGVNVH